MLPPPKTSPDRATIAIAGYFARSVQGAIGAVDQSCSTLNLNGRPASQPASQPSLQKQYHQGRESQPTPKFLLVFQLGVLQAMLLLNLFRQFNFMRFQRYS